MQLRCKVEGQDGGVYPRAIIADSLHLLSEKRACYLLTKWERKGWYKSYVTIDLGHLTADGKTATYEKEWTHQQK